MSLRSARTPVVAVLLAMAVCGCATTAPDRPHYGGNPLPVWHPLTAYEVEALKSRNAAARGDWRALLKLGLVASGAPRDVEELRGLEASVVSFLRANGPSLRAIPQPASRGKRLLFLLHRDVFATVEGGQLGRYSAQQSQLSVVLQDGTYNCISSALLYLVLARALGLDARGVKMPHHAFVEVRLADGRRIDVETTTQHGFGLRRDARWFAGQGRQWAAMRGLTTSSYRDYQRRQVVTPLRLVADNMYNQHTGPSRMAPAQTRRLRELRGELLPLRSDAQLYRLHALGFEHNEMHAAAESQAIVRMYRAVEPALAQITRQHGTNAAIKNLLGWHRSHYASALQETKNWAAAERWLDYAERLLPGIADAGRIEHNLLATAWREIQLRVAHKDIATARRIAQRWQNRCGSKPWCRQNMRWLRQF